MQSRAIGNAMLGFVLGLSVVFVKPSYAESNGKVEAGRLQICRVAGPATESDQVEIPLQGTYAIPSKELGLDESLAVSQVDFLPNLEPAAQANGNASLKDRYTIEARDGKTFVHLHFNGATCLYLHAQAPVLSRSDRTLSGVHVVPSWVTATDGRNINGISYRYFNAFDQTYYVASEVGRTLSFAVHDRQTGSNLNHDQVNRVDVTNNTVLNLVPVAIEKNLERFNQFDFSLIDLGKLSIPVQNVDLSDSDQLRDLVTQLSKKLQPPPHARLIIALPKKGQVQLKFSNATLVGGKLEGMGFYRDAHMDSIFSPGQEMTVPMDVFFNFQAAVIDLDSAKLVASGTFTEGHLFFSVPEPAVDLADSITDQRKMVALSGVVNAGVTKVMANMFETK